MKQTLGVFNFIQLGSNLSLSALSLCFSSRSSFFSACTRKGKANIIPSHPVANTNMVVLQPGMIRWNADEAAVSKWSNAILLNCCSIELVYLYHQETWGEYLGFFCHRIRNQPLVDCYHWIRITHTNELHSFHSTFWNTKRKAHLSAIFFLLLFVFQISQ